MCACVRACARAHARAHTLTDRQREGERHTPRERDISVCVFVRVIDMKFTNTHAYTHSYIIVTVVSSTRTKHTLNPELSTPDPRTYTNP